MQNQAILEKFSNYLSPQQLVTDKESQSFYNKGFRVGGGDALAVCIPNSLQELWKIIETCVEEDLIIIMQASNTGLTGGSTPDGNDYDRPVIIISTRKLKGIHLIEDAEQLIAFPGATLTELEDALAPHEREPHSVIGSSCIGASVIGGVCNNSGGSLIRRGPAFTEKSLYAYIDGSGNLSLINHLGINLGAEPEEILAKLDKNDYPIEKNEDWQGRIWAEDYKEKLRDIDNPSPARFNGDAKYLYESAGSSGKIIVFAVRLPSFPKNNETETFYIGSNEESSLIELKKQLLQNMTELPLQVEYIHRNAFELTIKYAKYLYIAIGKLGPQSMPKLMASKAAWERRIRSMKILPKNSIERILQLFNKVTPSFIASKLIKYHERFEHHLMIKIEGNQKAEMQAQLETFFEQHPGEYFSCNKREGSDAFLLRFAAAANTIAYCDYRNYSHEAHLVSLDIAFRRNDDQWRLRLPDNLAEQIELESCYGHFFCNVMHQDFVVKPGVDAVKFKHDVLDYIDQRGAKYPAEHNVGTLYKASDSYVAQFKKLDPTNSCNPGIGKTSKRKNWG